VQLIYAVFGAFFMPMLALSLLIMNNRVQWVGETFRNGWIVNAALILTLLSFLYMAAREAAAKAGSLLGL
jgi:hypothetical protein